MRTFCSLFLISLFGLPFVATLVLAGAEKCSIEGIVVAAGTQAPLAEAEVSISRDDAPGPRVVVRTDAAGHYAADGLEPGRYSLFVKRTGYVPQMYGQHGTHPEGIALTLGPGKRLQGIDFRLMATGVVGGRVFGQDGEPLVRADVQAFRPQYFRGKRRLMAGAAPARANDLGEYRIYGLPPGRYYVGVSGQGADETPTARPKGAPAEERYLPALYPNATDLDRATMVDVQPGGEAQGIDIVALKSRTFHVRGRIPDLGPADQDPRVQLEAEGTWEVGRRGGEECRTAGADLTSPGLLLASIWFPQVLFMEGILALPSGRSGLQTPTWMI
jgi:hypothetical protein